MERQVREYEKFIAAEAERKMSEAERAKLFELHKEMVANFQHERIIHLLVTLFFALFSIIALFVTAYVVSVYGFQIEMIPLYVLTLILVVLSACYVRHYYFLENHIQKLYQYTKKLS